MGLKEQRELEAAIAANRFGLGARPGELRTIAQDPRGWLQAQLEPERELPAPLAELPTTGEDQWAFWAWLIRVGRQLRKEGRRAAADGSVEDPAAAFARGDRMSARDDRVLDAFESEFFPRYEQALAARIRVARETRHPFRERLVHFWSNHFVVSSARPAAVALPPSFERDVARRHVLGRFEQMLRASCEHPAMLLYLDNASSIGPGSKQGLAGPRKRRFLPIDLPHGLNENLAREILELHTLGVDGGYEQQDVTALAKVLTGWQIRYRPLMGRFLATKRFFRFDVDAHEPGPQRILGKAYADAGVEQGRVALHDLAHHPATARFVATKLVRHFIDDDPPAAAVERLAAVFRASEGDLTAVSRALVDCPEAWDRPLTKLKRPEEFVVSAQRAIGGTPLDGAELHGILGAMGQRPYWAPTPAGWGDRAADWSGSDGLWKRIEWASTLAGRNADAGASPSKLARDVLGPTLGATTAREIERAASPHEGLALALASPEFQRR